MRSTPRMLLVMGLATAVVVGVIGLAAFDTWWVLVAALVAHAIGTVVVVGFIGGALSQTDKPDAVTEAAQAEGATDDGAAEVRPEPDEGPVFGIPERR
jgi:membrane protein implicated in regulation of membrane protease activity